jgi:transposase-like protein
MAEKWDKLEGESSKAYAAFCAYRDLGFERSIAKVAQACGKSVGLLNRWSSQYQWVSRADAYDQHLQKVKQAAEEAEIQRIMSEGYALVHKRVEALNKMAVMIEAELTEEAAERRGSVGALWVRDYRLSKDFCKEIQVFAAPIISELRATYADLAKELGQRIAKTDITLDANVKGYVTISPDDWDVEKQRLAEQD